MGSMGGNAYKPRGHWCESGFKKWGSFGWHMVHFIVLSALLRVFSLSQNPNSWIKRLPFFLAVGVLISTSAWRRSPHQKSAGGERGKRKKRKKEREKRGEGKERGEEKERERRARGKYVLWM